MAHRCSYCGNEGHKRPTCPELKGRGLGELLSPKPDPLPEGEHLGNIQSLDDLKAGDWVQPTKPGTAFYENLTWREAGVRKIHSVGDGWIWVAHPAVDAEDSSRSSKFEISGSYIVEGWSKLEPVSIVREEILAKVKNDPTWRLVERVIENHPRVLLYGPPGTGKTTVGNFAGNPSQVLNVTLTEDTPAAEIRGHYVPRGDEFVWQDGPALAAYRHGFRLVLNEIDKAAPDCMTFLHALLDDRSVSAITLPTGETVRPHEGFSVVATTNGTPDDLTEALADRLKVALYIPNPHPEAIASLPEDLQVIAVRTFNASEEERVSFRSWKAFAQLRDAIGEKDAATAVFGNRAKVLLNTLQVARAKGGEE